MIFNWRRHTNILFCSILNPMTSKLACADLAELNLTVSGKSKFRSCFAKNLTRIIINKQKKHICMSSVISQKNSVQLHIFEKLLDISLSSTQ
jgi:hypothetical protein